MIFSDYMHKYSANLTKTKVIVLLTDGGVYILNVKDYKLINYMNLEKLESILTIQTNSSIFALNFKGDHALLLESIRRTEVLIYLLNNAQNANRKPPKITKSLKLRLTSNHSE